MQGVGIHLGLLTFIFGENTGTGPHHRTLHTGQVQLDAGQGLPAAHGALVDVTRPVPGLARQRGADEHPGREAAR